MARLINCTLCHVAGLIFCCSGDHVTLSAIVEHYSVRVIIFSSFADSKHDIELVPHLAGCSHRQPLLLGHVSEAHYLSVIPRYSLAALLLFYTPILSDHLRWRLL